MCDIYQIDIDFLSYEPARPKQVQIDDDVDSDIETGRVQRT